MAQDHQQELEAPETVVVWEIQGSQVLGLAPRLVDKKGHVSK